MSYMPTSINGLYGFIYVRRYPSVFLSQMLGALVLGYVSDIVIPIR